MKKVTYLISLAAINLSACGTTNVGGLAGSLASQNNKPYIEQPIVVKPSTANLNIKNTIQIKKTNTTIIQNPFVLDVVKTNRALSFKGRNQTVGILGAETNYEILGTTRLQPITRNAKGQSIYCRLNGNSNYTPCLIDSNKDGSFNQTALNYNGHIFQKRDLAETVSYSSVSDKIDCNLNITIWRGIGNRYAISSALDNGSDCPRATRVRNLESVSIKKGELPKQYSIFGAEVLIHSIESDMLSYTVKRPISSGLTLTSNRY